MEELRVEIKKDNINYEDDVEAVLKNYKINASII